MYQERRTSTTINRINWADFGSGSVARSILNRYRYISRNTVEEAVVHTRGTAKIARARCKEASVAWRIRKIRTGSGSESESVAMGGKGEEYTFLARR